MGTIPQADLGAKAAKAIYRGKPRVVNRKAAGFMRKPLTTRIVPLSVSCRIQYNRYTCKRSLPYG